MYREADALHRQADDIIRYVATMRDLVPSSGFLAPAGNRLRGNLADVHARSNRAAGIVHAAADTLRAQAANLERDIARWEEEKRAEDRRIEEERQRAGQH